MTYTDKEIEDGITALMDRGQNKASALRAVLSMMQANMESLVIPAGARFLFGSGQPAAAKGADGDVYDDIVSGNRYYKDVGVWVFQYRAKGADGLTPVKGRDYADGYTPVKGRDYRDGVDAKNVYQLWLEAGNVGTLQTFLAWYRGTAQNGLDGKDGTIYHQESYDPAAADGKDGDIWQTSVSLTTERRWKKVAGVWRLFFDNTGSGVIVTPPNTAPNVQLVVAGTATAPKFTATAADSDGIASIYVKVYDASTSQLVQTFGPSAAGDTTYIATWNAAAAGNYTASAVATDTKGLSATSAPAVAFQVAAGALPTITGFLPMSGAQGSTVVLSGTNFTGATLVSINNGAVASFSVDSATQITAVLSSSQATGKVRVTTPAGTAVSGSDFTVVSGPAPANQLTPVKGNYWYNAGIERVNGAGQKIYAAGAMLRVNLMGSAQVTLNAFSTGGPILVVDGGTGTTYPINAPSGGQDFTLSGLSGGNLSIYLGSNQRTYDVGDVQGSGVTLITFPAGAQGQFVNPTQAAIAGVQINDSIGVGSGSSSPFQKGYAALLHNVNRSLTWLGYGSAQLYVALDPANRAALFAQIHAATYGAAKKFVLVESGSNDALGANGGGAAPLADIVSRFADFVAAFPAEFPGVPLIVMSPVNRDGEATANQFGWTMQQLRDELQAACAGKSFITFVPGENIIAPADRADFAHPNDTGHLKIFNVLDPVVASVTGSAPAPPAYSTTTGFTTWQNLDGKGSVDGSNPRRIYKTDPADAFGGMFIGDLISRAAASSTVKYQAIVQVKSGAGPTQIVYATTNPNSTHYNDTGSLWAVYWNPSNYQVFEGAGTIFPSTQLTANRTIQVVATDKVRFYADGAVVPFATTAAGVPTADIYLFAELGGVPNAGKPEVVDVQWFPANPVPRNQSLGPGTYSANQTYFVRTGTWATSGAYGGEAYTIDYYAKGKFAFTGNQLVVRGNIQADTRLSLSIDNDPAVTVDGSTFATTGEQVAYTFSNLSSGSHLLTVKKADNSNSYISITTLFVS